MNTRIAAAAGIVGVVLYLATVLGGASPPAPDAATSTVVAYYSQHRDAFLLQSALISVALLLLLPFLGAVYSALDGSEPGRRLTAVAAVAAFVLVNAVTFIGPLPLTAVVWQGASTAPASEVVMAFNLQNLSLYALSATLAAATVILPAVVILRYRALSRLPCIIGAASVVLNGVELAGIATRHGANAAGFGSGIGLFLWFGWVAALAVAILLHRKPVPHATTPMVARAAA